MVRSRIRAATATFILATIFAAGAVAPALAQQSPASLTANLFQGSCAELNETPLRSLRSVTASDPRVGGSFSGLPTALGVLTSESEVPVRLSTLLDSPHAIVIGDPAAPVACGDIGGITRGVVNNDEIRIGLWPVNDSGIFGIAEIEGDGGETDIDLYVAAPFQ